MKATSEKAELKKLIFNLFILALLFIFVMIIFPQGIKSAKGPKNSKAATRSVAKR